MHFLITGCSGAGKSTLINVLRSRGIATVSEPGRRVIAQGIQPAEDFASFVAAAEAMARSDLANAPKDRLVFFDRGLLDALAARERSEGVVIEDGLGGRRPYARKVFFADCWPEIFVHDDQRRHNLSEAQIEADHLRTRLPQLGYELVALPQTDPQTRAVFVMDAIRRYNR